MTDSGVNRRILNGMLDWLGRKDRQSFVFGATNFLENMDEASYRAGRFDKIAFAMYPNENARTDIFRVQCTLHRKLPVAEDLDYAYLAKQSFMMSGAEIEKWCVASARKAFVKNQLPITLEHFKDTKLQIEINKKERMDSVMKKVNFLRKLSNVDLQLLDESMIEFVAGESDKDRVSGFVEGLKPTIDPIAL